MSEIVELIKEYLKRVYDILDENIFCETEFICLGVRPASEREIYSFNKIYEETGEFVVSYYDYIITDDGNYFPIKVIVRLNASEEIEVEVHRQK